MGNWRRILAAALTASVCLFGATAAVEGATTTTTTKKTVKPPKPPTIHKWDVKPGDDPKLDRKLNDRAANPGTGKSRVIVEVVPGKDVSADAAQAGAKRGIKYTRVLNGELMEVPNTALKKLAASAAVKAMHWDRPTGGMLNRAAVVEGARAAQQAYGYNGAGVGVAVIDSGITSWHDDLTYNGSNPNVTIVNGQRVSKFVDFVNGQTTPYDDNGHGSHVAGIIAGNGYDTLGLRAGFAPAANIVSLKVLDSRGGGYISNAIAALDWVAANAVTYKIRVVNLSVGAAVTESYWTDPLTQAAKVVVDSGVVVVSAAGNLGKNPVTGKTQYGAITAPGNAPWVLTVGAYSHMGTIARDDDTIASYSSRGPTAIDFNAKPDIVATGTGIVSLSVPGSTLYNANPTFLLTGLLSPTAKPYLSLTGTSMAAPMVTGTVALMLQANPKLTPNLVKAILEYTAQRYQYNSLTQGAGFLNTKGAVDLARFFAHPRAGQLYPHNPYWSETLIWGNKKIKRGVIKPSYNAWAKTTVWGATEDVDGDNIVWGTDCPTTDADCDNIVWGTDCPATDPDCANVVWGTNDGDCQPDQDCDNIVWGTSECPAGTAEQDCDNIVWGTACGEVDCDNIVWGTECGEADCDNIVWGTSEQCSSDQDCDNIVWGTSGVVDAVVWGESSDPNNVTWGCAGEATPLFDDPLAPISAPVGSDNDPIFNTQGGTGTTTTSGTTIIGLLISPPPAIRRETINAAEWGL